MIGKNVKKFCDNFELIENYSIAINDESQVYQIHHRLETHYTDGKARPIDNQISRAELKVLGLYYHRPPSELIFLTNSEHTTLHHKGKTRSEEEKQRISNSKKGKVRAPFSEEWKMKISEANKGKIRSEETRKKMSEILKGNKRNLGKHPSEETLKKMREAALRRGEDYRRKISNALKGHKLSEETKRKISEAHKRRRRSNNVFAR